MSNCLSVYFKAKFGVTGVNTRTDHINQKKMDRGFNTLLKELPFQRTFALNKGMSICIVNVLFYSTLIVVCNFYFYCQWLLCGPAGLI